MSVIQLTLRRTFPSINDPQSVLPGGVRHYRHRMAARVHTVVSPSDHDTLQNIHQKRSFTFVLNVHTTPPSIYSYASAQSIKSKTTNIISSTRSPPQTKRRIRNSQPTGSLTNSLHPTTRRLLLLLNAQLKLLHHFVQRIDSVENVTSKPQWVRSTLVSTLYIPWMLSNSDTSWIASGLRAAGEGVGVMIAVDVEAVAGDTFGVSALSVVDLLGAGINSLDDTQDTVIIGSDGILDSVPERQ